MVTREKYGCRYIQVNNLDPRVDDALLSSVFSTAGAINSVKITHDRSGQHGLSTAHIEFMDHLGAEAAMVTLNGRKIYDTSVVLSWATNYSHRPREDTSAHFHLWAGDLAPEVDEVMLGRMFGSYASLSDARVMYDPATGRTRCFGFLAFRDKQDAEKALAQQQGRMLGSKPIRLNWAHQKNGMAAAENVQAVSGSGMYSSAAAFEHPKKPALNYNQVVTQASQLNTTIYIGNVPPNTTFDMLQPVFQAYGYVQDIKVHADRGFAFVKMDTHENAAMAICYLTGAFFNGAKLKVSWGKDKAADLAAAAYVQPQQQFYSYAGYGYAGGYPAYGAMPNQYYGYNQQAAYDPSTYAAYYQQYQAAMEAAAQQQQQQQQQQDAPQ